MSEQVFLTPREVDAVRDLCTGLHTEIGSPSAEYLLTCFDKTRTQRVLTKIGKTVLHFPTDAAADKWNKVLEKRIRYAGHVGTAALAVGVTLLTKHPGVGVAAGAGAGIAKDEVQARWPYPYARRDWRIEIHRAFTYKQDALSQDYLSITIWYEGYNHLGEKQYKMGAWSTRFEIGEEGGRIPRNDALAILAEAGKTTTKTINDVRGLYVEPWWY